MLRRPLDDKNSLLQLYKSHRNLRHSTSLKAGGLPSIYILSVSFSGYQTADICHASLLVQHIETRAYPPLSLLAALLIDGLSLNAESMLPDGRETLWLCICIVSRLKGMHACIEVGHADQVFPTQTHPVTTIQAEQMATRRSTKYSYMPEVGGWHCLLP